MKAHVPRLRTTLLLLLLSSLPALLLLNGCKRVFEYSLYTPDLPDRYRQKLNERHLGTIRANGTGQKTHFTIAVLSDTHYFLDEVHDAVDRINKDTNILFTVITGDLSDQGLTREYMEFYDEITRLEKPFLTVIGNHDYLSNAEKVYDQMFGPARNFNLDLAGYRFIFFDNIFWEKNGRPDFDWLEQQLSTRPSETVPVLFSHIPPFGDQYDPTADARHRQLVKDHGVRLSVHGHTHAYSSGTFDDDNNQYVVVPSTGNKQYCTISFGPAGEDILVTLVNF